MVLRAIGTIDIAGETTRLATCWRIARRDGEVFGFTEHDADLVVDGLTYVAATGFAPTAVSGKADMSIDELDIDGILDDDTITEADLMAGVWDHAEVRVFYVDWSSPADGQIKLRRGWLGPVTVRQGKFVASLHGLLSKAQNTQGREYGAWCDAKLGDSRCGVNLASYTESRAVSTVTDRARFAAVTLTSAVANYYQHGIVTWTSGANDGLSMEIKSNTGTSVELFLPMPRNIVAGDTFTITAGCTKSFTACRTKFNNVVRFRGFPHIPTTDEQVSGPDSPGTETGASFNPTTPVDQP